MSRFATPRRFLSDLGFDMNWLLDTSVLIALRDGDPMVRASVAELEGPAGLSVISVVELEGGVHTDPVQASRRRLAISAITTRLTVLAFGAAEATVYGGIVAAAGYSRRKILDRMIAAQALAAGAVLVTLNPDDFADVPGLKIRAVGSAAAPAS